jgi:hypothetical protein
MKILLAVYGLIFSSLIQAHHRKDHMMLLENTEQVVSSTQQGSAGGLYWLLWVGAFILLLLGFVRWWKARR